MGEVEANGIKLKLEPVKGESVWVPLQDWWFSKCGDLQDTLGF